MDLLLLFLATSTILTGADAFSVSPPFCINLKCKVQPNRRDEFLALVQDNQRLTLKEEPQALQYVIGEDTSETDTFYIHEEFSSHEGFLEHKETTYNANWQAFRATNPFLEDPTINFYEGTHHDAMKIPVRDAFCLDVQLCIEPSVREEFLSVIQNNARGSNEEEPLCLQYKWGEDTTSPNTFHFHEEYVGKEGFDVHAAAPHFQEWEAFAATNPFTKPPVVNFYKTV